jgi:hypothetical protein
LKKPYTKPTISRVEDRLKETPTEVGAPPAADSAIEKSPDTKLHAFGETSL